MRVLYVLQVFAQTLCLLAAVLNPHHATTLPSLCTLMEVSQLPVFAVLPHSVGGLSTAASPSSLGWP